MNSQRKIDQDVWATERAVERSRASSSSASEGAGSNCMVSNCTISKIYVHLICNYLAHENKTLNLPEHLSHVGPLSDTGYLERVSLAEMENLIYKASTVLGGLSFGLDIGNYIHPSDFGVVGYALMNCADLNQALHFAAHHKHAMNEGFQVNLSVKGEYCRFQIKNLTQSCYLNTLIELDLASALQLSRFLVGRQDQHRVEYIQVNFQHAPLGPIEKYEQLFGCPVKFGMDRNEIILSRSVLDLPVRSADPKLLKMYLRKVQRIQKKRKESVLIHQQVFSYIANRREPGFPAINDVASHFNMSLSTFKKKLQQEGYNYSGICDAVRKREAINLVESKCMSLKEIGQRLGFANPSAFNRAFKRWMDKTPAEYRKSALQKI